MNRKKVQNAGKVFGEYCKRIGAFFVVISAAMVPNENNHVNKGALIALIIALSLYMYGAWRTQNFMIDLEQE